MKLRLSGDWRWWSAATVGFALGVAGWLLLRDGLRTTPRASPPMHLLQRRMDELTGPSTVQVRHLGNGIVELAGRVEDPELEARLLSEASGVEGVAAVVSRLWGAGLPARGGG